MLNRAIELAGLRMVRNLGKRLGASRVALVAAELHVRDRLETGENLHRAAIAASGVIVREYFEREADPCPTTAQ